MNHDAIIAGHDPHASEKCGARPALREGARSAIPGSMAGDDADDDIDYEQLRLLVESSLKPAGRFSGRELSLLATEGSNPDLVRNFLKKGTKPSFKAVIGICSILELPWMVLAKSWDRPVPRSKSWLLINAAVEAGAWREHVEWGPEDWYEAEVERSDIGVANQGFIVRGRSMDRVFPPGTLLRCADLITSGMTWEDTDYVIVERRRSGFTELTCKRLSLKPDGNWELRAESYLEEFQDPIFIGRPVDTECGPSFDALNDDETRVMAIIVDAYLPLPRRRTRSLQTRVATRII